MNKETTTFTWNEPVQQEADTTTTTRYTTERTPGETLVVTVKKFKEKEGNSKHPSIVLEEKGDWSIPHKESRWRHRIELQQHEGNLLISQLTQRQLSNGAVLTDRSQLEPYLLSDKYVETLKDLQVSANPEDGQVITNLLELLKDKISLELEELTKNIEIKQTNIEGLLFLSSLVLPDNRGAFREVLRTNVVSHLLGEKLDIAQQNHIKAVKGSLRGLHSMPGIKAVTATSGIGFFVFADLRKDSKTFNSVVVKYMGEGITPSGEKIAPGCMIVPEGVYHGMLALSDVVDYLDVTTQEWTPEAQSRKFDPFDPVLNIQWPLKKVDGKIIISPEDIATIPERS